MWHDLVIYTPMYVTFFWSIVLLLAFRQKNRAKFFLGFFMLTASVLYFCHAIFFNKYYSIYLYFEPVYAFASLSVYPLYYWYIRLLTVETKMNYRNLWKLFPAFLIGLSISIIYMLMSPHERTIFINKYLLHQNTIEAETALTVIQKWVYWSSRSIFALQVLVYVVLGSKLVVQYNERIANFYSNLESKTIIWVRLLLFSFVLASIVSMVFNGIGKGAFFDKTWLLSIPSILFSILLFIIGLQGYMQNYTVTDLESDEIQSEEIDSKSYNTIKLNGHLISLFEDEAIFKNPDLKITHLSEMLRTNRTYISRHINTHYSCTFSDFVNRYRIEEAKRLLADDTSKNFSLNYISEKSGFGSMGSFIRVFRELEGITPGKYRDDQLIKNGQ